MPTLSDEIKEFIVKSLARYDTPSQVVYAVKETFGIVVSRQQVYRYDPDCSQPPASRWAELHAATRQKFLHDVATVGVAQKAVRLAMLDRMAHHALAGSCSERAAAFLEQAAKECGGIYENRPRVLAMAMPSAKTEAGGNLDAARTVSGRQPQTRIPDAPNLPVLEDLRG